MPKGSKISDQQIDEIKAQYATGTWTYRSLGAKHQLSYVTIHKIVRGAYDARPSKVASKLPAKPGFSSAYQVRFWRRVKQMPDDGGRGCWYWMGARTSSGAGSAHDPSGRTKPAHRISWDMEYGTEPTGQLVHTCGVACCVRPSHLASKVPEPVEAEDPAVLAEVCELDAVRILNLQCMWLCRDFAAVPPITHETLARYYKVSVEAVKYILRTTDWKKVSKGG